MPSSRTPSSTCTPPNYGARRRRRSRSPGICVSGSRRTLELVAEMEARGLIRTTGAGLALTSSGQEIAVRVIRAHRLLERYLADELQMPLEAIDVAADRREHTVTPEDATALEARSDSCVRPPTGEHRRGRDRRLMVDRKVG